MISGRLKPALVGTGKACLLTAIAVALPILFAGAASAYVDDGSTVLSARPRVGACTSQLRYDESDAKLAYIYVESPDGERAYAGGGGYLGEPDGGLIPKAAVSPSWLQRNCGLTSVSAFAASIDGIRWTETSRIGLAFDYVFNNASYFYTGEVVEEATNGTSRLKSTRPLIGERRDLSRPQVELTGDRIDLAGAESIRVTVRFSEMVTGFSAGDILTSNARVRAFEAVGDAYEITLAPAGPGPLQVAIAENVAFDAAGNGNLSSRRIVFSDSSVLETQMRIAAFQRTRASRLIVQQPDLTSFLTGRGPGGLDVGVTPGLGHLTFASSPGLPLWVSTDASWTAGDTDEALYAFIAVGSHVEIAPNLLLGAMLEADYLEQKAGESVTEGSGWMTGPYFVHSIPRQKLYLEGTLLYGQSDNTVSPYGSYSDNFRTSRWLLRTKMTGEVAFGSATLSPNLNVSYTTDKTEEFSDSRGNVIPAQKISMGQFAVGLDVRLPLNGQDGDLNLTGGFDTSWSLIRYHNNVNPGTSMSDGFGGRLEVGLDYTPTTRRSLKLSGHCDALGFDNQNWCGMGLLYKVLI